MREMEKFYVIEFGNGGSFEDLRFWDFGLFFQTKEQAIEFLESNGYESDGFESYSNPDINDSIQKDGFEFGEFATIKSYSAYKATV